MKARYRKIIQRISHAYVYVIGNEFYHWYKIGVGGDAHDRLKNCQVGCPVKLKLICSAWAKDPYETEQQLHEKYSSRRLHGEWFLLQDEEIAELKSYLSVIDLKRVKH